MKILVLTIVFIFLCFLVYEIYIYFNKFQDKKAEYMEITQKSQDIKKNLEDLNSELNYYSKTENLIKDLKKQFNYKFPFEKLIILVPQNNTTSN